MEFRLLGSVEVWADGQWASAGQPRQRMVLAALLIDAGRLVTSETLIDRVWGTAAPATARRTLHAHIARIRQVLARATVGGAEGERLQRRSGGYLLDVDQDQVDALRFRRLVGSAGDPRRTDAERLGLAREALGLWRGEPMAGLTGPWVQRVRDSWHRQHLDAVRAWAQAELRVGDPGVTIDPLADLIAEDPLDEPLIAALMRALHAVGRTAEALALFARSRRRLVEELGTEPGAELRQLHQEIVRGDPATTEPPAPSHRTPAAVVPAQLPLGVQGFVARRAELAHLGTSLAEAGGRTDRTVVVAVTGTAGIGKTTLALHWAHQVADQFPDGQLYVDLRGFDPAGPPMAPAEALRMFLDALHLPAEQVPPDLEARAALFRSLITGRRMLVLLDNARDTAQVRPLLPAAPGCLVLVTSRDQMAGLVARHNAVLTTLGPFTPAEGGELLACRIGTRRAAAEPAATEEIVQQCGGLPLAMAVVAARAAARPGLALATLAEELCNSRGLAAFADQEVTIDARAVFSWSYQTLTEPAARLFRLLGLHAGPDISVGAAASTAGVSVGQVRRLLTELTRAHMLTEQVPGRFVLHDLLRAYAGELVDEVETEVHRQMAMRRILDHYLHTAYRAALRVNAARDPITLAPPDPDVTPEDFPDHRQALCWYEAEYRVVLRALRLAADNGFGTRTWQLAWTLVDYLQRRGDWHDQAAAHQIALGAAESAADRLGQAHAHWGLGRAYTRLGRYGDAQHHFQQALDLFGAIECATHQGHVHNSIGHLLERRECPAEALHHCTQALDLYRATQHRCGQANALAAIGWFHTLLGEHERSVEYCQEALSLLCEVGDQHGQAGTWHSLGHATRHLGQYARAMACYQQAIALYADLGDRLGEADSLDGLGDTKDAAGQRVQAHAVWRQAYTILDQLHHPDADRVRAKLPGGR
jgi:DNA-binding SARP family transcriptional activator/tetratricopeptide (TPR) repeat protein